MDEFRLARQNHERQILNAVINTNLTITMEFLNSAQTGILKKWLGQKGACFPLAICGTICTGKTLFATALSRLITRDQAAFKVHGASKPELLIQASREGGVYVLDNVGSLSEAHRDVIALLVAGKGEYYHRKSHSPDDIWTIPIPSRVVPLIITSYSNSHSGADSKRFITPLEAIRLTRTHQASKLLESQIIEAMQNELTEKLGPELQEFRKEFGFA